MQKVAEGMQWALIQMVHTQRVLEELLVKYNQDASHTGLPVSVDDRVCTEFVLK